MSCEGDRVALHLPNSVDFVVAALACLWIGAIFVPLAVTDPAARLDAILADCAPAVVVTSDEEGDADVETSPSFEPGRWVRISAAACSRRGAPGAGPDHRSGGLRHLHVGHHRHPQGSAHRQPCLRRRGRRHRRRPRPRRRHPHAVRVAVPLRRVLRHAVPHPVLRRGRGHPAAGGPAVPPDLLQCGHPRIDHLHGLLAQLPASVAVQPPDRPSWPGPRFWWRSVARPARPPTSVPCGTRRPTSRSSTVTAPPRRPSR